MQHQLCEAEYPVGILIVPIIMVEDWENLYLNLIKKLSEELSQKAKNTIFIEIIFVTYSYIHRMINTEAFKNALNFYSKNLMTGRGRGKYCYRKDLRSQGEIFLETHFPNIYQNAI